MSILVMMMLSTLEMGDEGSCSYYNWQSCYTWYYLHNSVLVGVHTSVHRLYWKYYILDRLNNHNQDLSMCHKVCCNNMLLLVAKWLPMAPYLMNYWNDYYSMLLGQVTALNWSNQVMLHRIYGSLPLFPGRNHDFHRRFRRGCASLVDRVCQIFFGYEIFFVAVGGEIFCKSASFLMHYRVQCQWRCGSCNCRRSSTFMRVHPTFLSIHQN